MRNLTPFQELWHNEVVMNDDTAQKVDAYFGNYRVRHYKKGQILILNGDDPEYIYRIVSGKVKQYDVTYRGDEVIVNIFKAGAFFPMSMAINREPSQFIYEAETDIDIRQAPFGEVLEFVKANPDVLLDLLSRVYRGVDGLLGRMVHLMASSAKGRLMFELLIECRRFGEGGDKVRVVHLSEKDLGARAGLSRETVSREISKLSRLGLVAVESGRITILDIEAFESAFEKVR